MQAPRDPDAVWAQLEDEAPDLAPAPVAPARTAERVWRFEWPDPGVLVSGVCGECGQTHVPDRATLDRVLREIQLDGAEVAPCVCGCCVIAFG